MAGMRGIGALGFQFVSADAAQAWVHAYYNAYTKREKLADPTRPTRTSPSSASSCAPTTDEEAQGGPRAGASSSSPSASTTARPGRARHRQPVGRVPGLEGDAHGTDGQLGGLIGSPETILAQLRKFEETHVDQVILLNQAGRTPTRTSASLERFATDVMPEFHEREAEHQEWKRQVLAGEIELEELDTEPFNIRSNQTPKFKRGMKTPEPVD